MIELNLALILPEQYKYIAFIPAIIGVAIGVYLRFAIYFRRSISRVKGKRITHLGISLLALSGFLLSEEIVMGVFLLVVPIIISLVAGGIRWAELFPNGFMNQYMEDDYRSYSEGENFWEKLIIFLWY